MNTNRLRASSKRVASRASCIFTACLDSGRRWTVGGAERSQPNIVQEAVHLKHNIATRHERTNCWSRWIGWWLCLVAIHHWPPATHARHGTYYTGCLTKLGIESSYRTVYGFMCTTIGKLAYTVTWSTHRCPFETRYSHLVEEALFKERSPSLQVDLLTLNMFTLNCCYCNRRAI